MVEKVNYSKDPGNLIIASASKNKFDLNWLKTKTDEQLQILTREFQQDMNVRAQILAQDFMSKDLDEFQKFANNVAEQRNDNLD